MPRRIGARVLLAAHVLVAERREAEHLVPVGRWRAARSARRPTCPTRPRRRSVRPCWCRRPGRSGCDALRTSARRRRARGRARCRRRTRRRSAAAAERPARRLGQHAPNGVMSKERGERTARSQTASARKLTDVGATAPCSTSLIGSDPFDLRRNELSRRCRPRFARRWHVSVVCMVLVLVRSGPHRSAATRPGARNA